jgi:hypothetical protein
MKIEPRVSSTPANDKDEGVDGRLTHIGMRKVE